MSDCQVLVTRNMRFLFPDIWGASETLSMVYDLLFLYTRKLSWLTLLLLLLWPLRFGLSVKVIGQ